MTIYEISPVGIYSAQFIFITMACLTISAIVLTYAVRGWRAWWMMLGLATIMPVATALAFAGFKVLLPFPDFVSGVVLPLAITVGIGSLVLGIPLGLVARWALRAYLN